MPGRAATLLPGRAATLLLNNPRTDPDINERLMDQLVIFCFKKGAGKSWVMLQVAPAAAPTSPHLSLFIACPPCKSHTQLRSSHPGAYGTVPLNSDDRMWLKSSLAALPFYLLPPRLASLLLSARQAPLITSSVLASDWITPRVWRTARQYELVHPCQPVKQIGGCGAGRSCCTGNSV